MIKPEDDAENFVFSHLTHHQKERRKRSIKTEPKDNFTERRRKVDLAPPSLFASSLAEFDECGKCGRAKSAGLDAWMDHLGACHTFPSRWPSSRIKDGLLDREHPYTSVVDSHKKRKSAGIPRPLNSFMIFAQYIRRMTLSNFPDAPNVHISQQVGRLWRNLSNDYREVYATESRRLQDLHSLEFPDYKYQPRRRLRSEDIEPSSAQFTSSCPPSQSTNYQDYLELYPENSIAKPPPKNPSPSRKFDPSNVSSELASCFFSFPSLSNRSLNTDTLTSLQEVDNCQHDESSYYQGTFSYVSTSTDRLSWTEDRMLTEPPGPPTLTPAPVVAPPDEMLSPVDNWYRYPRESTYGTETPPLPGIETWTFSGPTT